MCKCFDLITMLPWWKHFSSWNEGKQRITRCRVMHSCSCVVHVTQDVVKPWSESCRESLAAVFPCGRRVRSAIEDCWLGSTLSFPGLHSRRLQSGSVGQHALYLCLVFSFILITWNQISSRFWGMDDWRVGKDFNVPFIIGLHTGRSKETKLLNMHPSEHINWLYS